MENGNWQGPVIVFGLIVLVVAVILIMIMAPGLIDQITSGWKVLKF